MVRFESYSKPIAPNGTSLFVIYFLYTALSITYAYNQEFGTKFDADNNALFISIIVLSFPFIFWPLTGDEEFSKEYLEPFGLNSTVEDNSVTKFIKKFLGGYIIAFMFPFLKLKAYLVVDKNNPPLKAYMSKEYFNYYVVPVIGFIVFVVALIIAIYFNESVINATNDVGIFLMNPNQRRTYQLIFSFLLFTMFFSLIPYKMAEALDKTWNYYLMFFFSVINLIIINEQLNNNPYRKNVLSAVYGITIVLLLYSIYNLIYMSSESKDYRILTLGKLTDEDRININGELYGIYDAVRLIRDQPKYFKDNYFVPSEAISAGFNAEPALLKELDGSRKEGFVNIMKRLDQDFINIYQARMSWEKSLRRFFKAKKDDDKKDIINGFFESTEFRNLEKMESPTLSQAAKNFRSNWTETRKTLQLPKPNFSQALFGAAITTIGGNVALSAAASKILREIDTVIKGNTTILFQRYMFVKLSEQFRIVSQVFKTFEIYNVGEAFGTEESPIEKGGFDEENIKKITQINNYYSESNKLLANVANAAYAVKSGSNTDNLVPNIEGNSEIFNKYFNIFSNDPERGLNLNFPNFRPSYVLSGYIDADSLNESGGGGANVDPGFEIFISLSKMRYNINKIITIYNLNIARADDERKAKIAKKYKSIMDRLYQSGVSILKTIYAYNEGRIIPLTGINVLSREEDIGYFTGGTNRDAGFFTSFGLTEAPPGAPAINAIPYVGAVQYNGNINYYETRAVANTVSYRLVKPIDVGRREILSTDVVDLERDFNGTDLEILQDNFLIIPYIPFESKLLKDFDPDDQEGFQYVYDNSLGNSYFNLIRQYMVFINITNNNMIRVGGLRSVEYSLFNTYRYDRDGTINSNKLHNLIIDTANIGLVLEGTDSIAQDSNDFPQNPNYNVQPPGSILQFLVNFIRRRNTMTDNNRENIIKLVIKSSNLSTKNKKSLASFVKGSTTSISNFFTSTKPIDDTVRFFNIKQPAYPGDSTTIEDIEENVVYSWDNTTSPDNLTIGKKISEPIYKYLEEASNITKNSEFERLSTEQKNTILRTKDFRTIFEYYFDEKPKNSKDVDKLYDQFLAIYRSYIRTLRAYLVASNPSSRGEKDITTGLIPELRIIGRGFPEIMRDKYPLYGEETLIDLIEIGKAETDASEESYNNAVSNSNEFKKNRIVSAQVFKEAEQKVRELNIKVETQKSAKFREIVSALSKGVAKNLVIEIAGNKVLNINFLADKTVTGIGAITKNEIHKMAFTSMTRILLKTLEFIKGDLNWNVFGDGTNFMGTANSYQVKTFLTKLMAALFVSALPIGLINGLARNVAANNIRDNTIAAPIISTSPIFWSNAGLVLGASPATDMTRNVMDFLNTIGNRTPLTAVDFDVSNRTGTINDRLKQIEEYMHATLARIIASFDVPAVTGNAAIKKSFTEILNNSGIKNNIFYHLLLRMAERKNALLPADNVGLDGLFRPTAVPADIDYVSFIRNMSNKLEDTEENLLVSLLEQDYKRLMEDDVNKEDPLGTFAKAVEENPIVNSLKIITKI